MNILKPDFYPHAEFSREIAHRLVARLAYIKLKPQRILSLHAGFAADTDSALLGKLYPEAEVIALCADTQNLPIADNSVDLLYAHFVLPCVPDKYMRGMLADWERVLKPGGLMMFTALGPDSYKELRQSCLHPENRAKCPEFGDMHELGDLLVYLQLVDTVLDVERVQFAYEDLCSLLQEVRLPENFSGLESQEQWQKRYREFYPQAEGLLLLTYEVIYGHAWKRVMAHTGNNNSAIASVPVSQLRGRGQRQVP